MLEKSYIGWFWVDDRITLTHQKGEGRADIILDEDELEAFKGKKVQIIIKEIEGE
jgi:hypothetical protein